ncbi:MAG: hypothetical protein MI861_07780, partial [Pirellulales bacterium]|nr:hypothetical protein [Pirellulales bacterium]
MGQTVKITPLLIFGACVFLSGCSTVPQLFNNGVQTLSIKAREQSQLARIRAETREQLAAERMEAARLQAERDVEFAREDVQRQQLENQFCDANREALRQKLKSNVEDKVRSRMAFDVTQGLQVG